LYMAFRGWHHTGSLEQRRLAVRPEKDCGDPASLQRNSDAVQGADQQKAHFLRFTNLWSDRWQHEEKFSLLCAVIKAWEAATSTTRCEQAASQRFTSQLEEARSTCREEVEAMRKEVAIANKAAGGAVRGERRCMRALDVLTQAGDLEQTLLVITNAWRAATVASLQAKLLARSVAEVTNRSEVAIACVRSENRNALRTAWDGSVDTTRHRAAMERRQAAENDSPAQKAVLREVLSERPPTASRPCTAREIEKELDLVDEQARRRSANGPRGCVAADILVTARPPAECQTPLHRMNLQNLLCERPRTASRPDTAQDTMAMERQTCTTPSSRSMLHNMLCERPGTGTRLINVQEIEPEEIAEDHIDFVGLHSPSSSCSAGLDIISLGARHTPFSSSRAARRDLITEVVHMRRGDGKAVDQNMMQLVLHMWCRHVAERSLDRVDAEKHRAVEAAREGRKGIFVAAMDQQARYWMADAFSEWRRKILEVRCARLQSSTGTGSPCKNRVSALKDGAHHEQRRPARV
jgi:hypothetical protein